MNFGQALAELKLGNQVARTGWNGKNMFLFIIWTWSWPTPLPLPRLPFIAMQTATQEIVPWLPSQTDLLAEDWESL